MFFHCAPNVLMPSSVIRLTTWAGGSCGGMIGIGLGAGAGAGAARPVCIMRGNAAIAAQRIKLHQKFVRIVLLPTNGYLVVRHRRSEIRRIIGRKLGVIGVVSEIIVV